MKINSYLTHPDTWKRGPQQQQTTAQPATLQLGEAGYSERRTAERREGELSKECGQFEQENFLIPQKR